MPTDPTPDFERIGREHAKRLGIKVWEVPSYYGNYWMSSGMPMILLREVNGVCRGTESEFYIALGRAVHACELACGLADRVRAAREAERDACLTIVANSLEGFQPITPIGLIGKIAAAIRGRKGQ